MSELDANATQEDSVVLPGHLDKSNTVEVETESSPVSGESHEQKTNGVQDRINKITAKAYQQERRADDIQRQLDDANAKLSSQTPAKVEAKAVTAPVLPEDIYDEDAMRKYYNDSASYNQELAQSTVNSTLEDQKRKRTEQVQKDKNQELISGYYSNAQRDGVDLDKLRVAETMVSQSGIDNSLAQHIMTDVHGGKIVEFLHDNPEVLQELTSMSPMAAAIKIANDIKPQALSQAPRVSNAPAPATDIRGGGVIEQDEFEKNYPGATFI